MTKTIAALSMVALLAAGCGETTSSATSEPAVAETTTTAGTTTAIAEVPQAATATETPADPAGSDVTGPYFPTTALSGEFAELDHLLLATIDENGDPAPLNGFLRSKKASAKDYILVQPALAGRKLTFTTTVVNGVNYSFDGTFTRLDHFAVNAPQYDEVVLSGTLTRLRNGTTVATTPVNFAYQAGG